MQTLLVGPLLGVESDTHYTFCFLTSQSVTTAHIFVEGVSVAAIRVAETYRGTFWRAETSLSRKNNGRHVTYGAQLDSQDAQDVNGRAQWRFYVAGRTEKPNIAYASCNGFSSLDLVNKTEQPYHLWEKMALNHQTEPYALLLLGGDQLYADEIWGKVAALDGWTALSRKNKVKRKATVQMREQMDRFYDGLYQQRWREANMSLMFASIPSVMMWDDHDIFDGWGSYPPDLQACEVFQAIFACAKRYFELFQIRSKRNISLLNPAANHYAMAFKFSGYHILALDNRAERTLSQVMSNDQWNDVIGYLDSKVTAGNLLVLAGVPVVYRDFSLAEAGVDFTPWEEELTDDLKDHWRAKEHQGERARLIMRLLENAKIRDKDRTVILSGDVHIGCLGVVTDRRDSATIIKLHQVVSSGIVHPAPSRIAWLGIMAITNDKNEWLNEEKTIETSIIQPFGSEKYLRVRNYVTLKEGTDNKLWVNWICESKDKPAYPLV